MQNGQPVAYASRALTLVQIEKELLTIVFACKKFEDYIYGHDKVHMKSDHTPIRVHHAQATQPHTKMPPKNAPQTPEIQLAGQVQRQRKCCWRTPLVKHTYQRSMSAISQKI